MHHGIWSSIITSVIADGYPGEVIGCRRQSVDHLSAWPTDVDRAKNAGQRRHRQESIGLTEQSLRGSALPCDQDLTLRGDRDVRCVGTERERSLSRASGAESRNEPETNVRECEITEVDCRGA